MGLFNTIFSLGKKAFAPLMNLGKRAYGALGNLGKKISSWWRGAPKGTVRTGTGQAKIPYEPAIKAPRNPRPIIDKGRALNDPIY